MVSPLRSAQLIVLVVPALLLGGALGFQHLGGLHPCEMCLWQRWPHVAALVLGTMALVVPPAPQRLLVALAALAMLATGAIGIFHAGVEQGWWQGITDCAAPVIGGSLATDIFAVPVVRCDAVAWSLLGISMAGYNALISIAGGGFALWLLTRR